MTPAGCFVRYSRRSTSGSRLRGFNWDSTGLTTEVLRREAEAMIEPKEADEAVENKSRTNDE